MGQQPRPETPKDRDRPATQPVDERSQNEWVVLALLVEAQAHGFALAKALTADGDLGRILTVRRPLVYRALDRLAAVGLVEPSQTEPGDAGPRRTVFTATPAGVSALEQWLAIPVVHVRDLRVGFLLKLRLLERRGSDPQPLIAAQRLALDETIDGLIHRQTDTEADKSAQPRRAAPDVVDLWRSHNAMAASRFLDELQSSRMP